LWQVLPAAAAKYWPNPAPTAGPTGTPHCQGGYFLLEDTKVVSESDCIYFPGEDHDDIGRSPSPCDGHTCGVRAIKAYTTEHWEWCNAARDSDVFWSGSYICETMDDTMDDTEAPRFCGAVQ
jgi:hypothetical protein